MKKLINILPPFNKLISISNNNIKNNTIQIFICFTTTCNFSCKYCYNEKYITKQFINIDDVYIFIIKLHKFILKNIDILIVGGEPTLHPQLFDFCEKCNILPYINIYIHSNLSANINIYKKILFLKNTFFIFSWHSQNKDFYKKTLLLKNIINNNYIFKKQLFIVMYEHLNIELAKIMYKMLIHINATVELSLIDISIKRNNQFVYTKKQINDAIQLIGNKSENNLMLKYQNNSIFYISEFQYNCLLYFNYIKSFFSWKCKSGYLQQQIYIHIDGNIYPCTTQYYLKNKPIGNINDNINTFEKKDILCCFHCQCPPISKFKI